MTWREYRLLCEGYSYRMVDESYRDHQLAWIIAQAGAVKSDKKGNIKPVHETFEHFYDYKKALAVVDKGMATVSTSGTKDPASRYREYLKSKKVR